MEVPEWYDGYFVDDEMWVSFQSSGGWLEIGQTAGYSEAGETNCCTLHPFIAHAVYTGSKGEIHGYEEYTWIAVDAEPTNLYKVEDAADNGNWCEYIWNSVVDCHSKSGYWSTYSDELEAGIEAASNIKPYNGGSQEVDAVAREGSHRAWTGSETSAVGELVDENGNPLPAGVMCETPNYSSNYPGNATWWIC